MQHTFILQADNDNHQREVACLRSLSKFWQSLVLETKPQTSCYLFLSLSLFLQTQVCTTQQNTVYWEGQDTPENDE